MTNPRRKSALARQATGSATLVRRTVASLLALGAVGVGWAQDEEYSPQTYGIDRYEHIWEQSPFIVETKVVTQSDGLEAQFSLTGLASVGGKPIAFIYDRNTLGRFSVGQGETSNAGVELISIEMARNPRESRAIIQVGSEQASIGYDPASLVQTTSTGVSGQVPGADTGTNAAATIQRRTIPAPAANPPPPQPGQPAAARTIKRRTINIPTD